MFKRNTIHFSYFFGIALKETYLTHDFRKDNMPKTPNIDVSLFPLSLFLLNPNVTSLYFINSTAFDLINGLAIEEWNDAINYDLYYSNCHPTYCFYTISTNSHIPTIVTTIIGLVGGLSFILRLSILPLTKTFRRYRRSSIENVRVSSQGQ